jgi:hypothetical protein
MMAVTVYVLIGHRGSCIRYQPQEQLPRERAGAGTTGWKAPELESDQGTEQLISPAAADAYSFGLLVAYVMLGKDLFRLQSVARFLFDNYFDSTKNAGAFPASARDIILVQDASDVREVRARLQDMMQQHTPTLLGFIFEAVAALGLPEADAEALVIVLKHTIQPSPENRVADFAALTAVLGGDPAERRHR